MPVFSKRLLISAGLLPLMLSAAPAAPQQPSERPCGCEGLFSDFPFARMHSSHHASTMKESDKAYLISIDLPGMDKKDIKVETTGNRLMVSGERTEKIETREASKRSHAQFRRSYLLPDDADISAIEATSKNGVLKITIPKSASKAKTRSIDIR